MYRVFISFFLIHLLSSSVQAQVCDPNPVDCLVHDDTLWHGNEDPATGLCWDHEHGDDPHVLNWLFGPPGAWYGGPEVGSRIKSERHDGYLWMTTGPDVLDPTTMPSDFISSDGMYIAAMRRQTHFLTNPVAKTVRFHSDESEQLLCDRDTGECGILRIVTMADFGSILLVRPDYLGFPPPSEILVTREDYPLATRPTRLLHPQNTHLALLHTWYGDVIAPFTRHNASYATDDGTSSHELLDSNLVDCSGPFCTTPIENIIIHPEPGDESRNTWHFAHFNPSFSLPLNGEVWFDPFTGAVKTDCVEVGPNCGLLRSENLPPDTPGCCYKLVNFASPPEHATPLCEEWIER